MRGLLSNAWEGLKPGLGDIQDGKYIGKKPYTKYIWHACNLCGKERWVSIYNLRKRIQQMCKSCQATTLWQAGKFKYNNAKRECNPNWKGGKHTRPDSYVEIRLAQEDFFYPMCNRQGYIFEHRLVMARHLKRCLLPWEVVHHKNGIRGDNRLENLALIGVSGEHNTALNKRIKQLERVVEKQSMKIKLLEFRLREIENAKVVQP